MEIVEREALLCQEKLGLWSLASMIQDQCIKHGRDHGIHVF
jgi:hypothetical protein